MSKYVWFPLTGEQNCNLGQGNDKIDADFNRRNFARIMDLRKIKVERQNQRNLKFLPKVG